MNYFLQIDGIYHSNPLLLKLDCSFVLSWVSSFSFSCLLFVLLVNLNLYISSSSTSSSSSSAFPSNNSDLSEEFSLDFTDLFSESSLSSSLSLSVFESSVLLVTYPSSCVLSDFIIMFLIKVDFSSLLLFSKSESVLSFDLSLFIS